MERLSDIGGEKVEMVQIVHLFDGTILIGMTGSVWRDTADIISLRSVFRIEFDIDEDTQTRRMRFVEHFELCEHFDGETLVRERTVVATHVAHQSVAAIYKLEVGKLTQSLKNRQVHFEKIPAKHEVQ